MSLLPATQGECCPLTSPSSATQHVGGLRQFPSASEMLLTLRDSAPILLHSHKVPQKCCCWCAGGLALNQCRLLWLHMFSAKGGCVTTPTCLQNKHSFFLCPCSKTLSMKPCPEHSHLVWGLWRCLQHKHKEEIHGRTTNVETSKLQALQGTH